MFMYIFFYVTRTWKIFSKIVRTCVEKVSLYTHKKKAYTDGCTQIMHTYRDKKNTYTESQEKVAHIHTQLLEKNVHKSIHTYIH